MEVRKPLFCFQQVKELTPQVSHSAKILLLNPDSEAASGHFDAMKKEWQGKVERITELVDSATDTSAFLEASGKWKTN